MEAPPLPPDLEARRKRGSRARRCASFLSLRGWGGQAAGAESGWALSHLSSSPLPLPAASILPAPRSLAPSPLSFSLFPPSRTPVSPAAHPCVSRPLPGSFPAVFLSVCLGPQDTSTTTRGPPPSTMATPRRPCLKGRPRSPCTLRPCGESWARRPRARRRRPPRARSWPQPRAATSTATRPSARATRLTPSSSPTGARVVRPPTLMPTPPPLPQRPRLRPPTATAEVGPGRERVLQGQGQGAGAARARGRAPRRARGLGRAAPMAGTLAASAARRTLRRRT